jgi:anti-sigma B factor antagonist
MIEITQYSLDDVPVIGLGGDLDHSAAPVFDEAVAEALGEDGRRLLLQLTDCPYIDSGGLSSLLLLLRRIRPDGWLGIIAPSPDVRRLLDLVGLTVDPSFLVFPNLDEAKAYLYRVPR